MSTFRSINDKTLAELIIQARNRVIYVAPGVGINTVNAFEQIIKCGVIPEIIIDSDEDAYRIGYGDHKALAQLHELSTKQELPLRQQIGLRVGMLVTDDTLVFWAPTAQSVEAESQQDKGQPNAIMMQGSVTKQMEEAVGSDHSSVLPKDSEIGRDALNPEELKQAVENLDKNPPAPFDLAQKSRVFSTRFQFVEFTVRGADWSNRRISLSNLLFNADLPKELRDLLETKVRPYQIATEFSFEIPMIIDGEPVFKKDGSPMMELATQAFLRKRWGEIRDKYLKQLKGFGWLIRKDQLKAFRVETELYEESLVDWVVAFKKKIENEEVVLINSIVKSISSRLKHADDADVYKDIDLKEQVRKGLAGIRLIDPEVRIVLKNVSWESSRDNEFTKALGQAFSEDELKGWFDEYTAARERN